MDDPQSVAVPNYSRQARRLIERFNRKQQKAALRTIGDLDDRFNPETINQMTAVCWRIAHYFDYIHQLARKQGRTYIWPRQDTVARAVNCSREWVSRCTTHMARIGILRKIYRRPEAGEYRSCLYFLNKNCRWLLGRVLWRLSSKKRGNPHPGGEESVMFTARKPTPRTSNSLSVGELASAGLPPGLIQPR